MDLAELQEIEDELNLLKQPATGEELTEAEHQEATGVLLIRSLQNPNLFRSDITEVQLGKYKAIFVRLSIATDIVLRVKFVRT